MNFPNLDNCQKLYHLPIFLVFEEPAFHLEIMEIRHVLKTQVFHFVRYFLKIKIFQNKILISCYYFN